MVGEKQLTELIPTGSEESHAEKRVLIHTGQVGEEGEESRRYIQKINIKNG